MKKKNNVIMPMCCAISMVVSMVGVAAVPTAKWSSGRFLDDAS